MPRIGWSSLPTPAGLYQVIRGPRPKAATNQQWPFSISWWQYGGHWPVAKPKKPRSAASREMSSFHSTTSKPIALDGAGTGRRAKKAPRSFGASDQVAQRNQQSHHQDPCSPLRKPVQPDPTLTEPPPVASACRRRRRQRGKSSARNEGDLSLVLFPDLIGASEQSVAIFRNK